MLFACIGEQFQEPNVCGVGLSLRTKERLIEVWLREASEAIIKSVSLKIQDLLSLDTDSTTLYFKEHSKALTVRFFLHSSFITHDSCSQDKSTMKNASGFKFLKGDRRKRTFERRNVNSKDVVIEEKKEEETK